MMKPFNSEAQAGGGGGAVGGDTDAAFDPIAIVDQMKGSKLMESLGAQVALTTSECLQRVRDLNLPTAAGDITQAVPLSEAVIAALGVIPAQKAMGVSEALLFGEQILLMEILAKIQTHAAAVLLQQSWRSSQTYKTWQARADAAAAMDPAKIQAALEAEKAENLRRWQAAKRAENEADERLREESAFRIQELWRYNRNRKYLAQRGLREAAVPEQPAAETPALESAPPGADHAQQLKRVEDAYQKALQQRAALMHSTESDSARYADQLGFKPNSMVYHASDQVYRPIDHSAIPDLAKTSPLKVTAMAAQFPAGKYNKKYQRKYALAQDGTPLETGYNSDDSSASSMTDSDFASSDEGIDMMTA